MSNWPTGDGEMARLIRAHDWASTPLGPAVTWSERLKLMVEQVLASPLVSSLVCGPERVLIYNDAAAQLYEGRHPAALGQPLSEVFPEGWKTVEILYERVFAGESVHVTGQPLDTRGEGEVGLDIFDAVLTPIHDEEGRVTWAHMVGFEVGARVRTEVALRASEARHRLLIGSWAQAVWEADATGVVTADSPSWRGYTGQTLEEWLGYGWLDAIHPDDRAYADRQWREAIAARALFDVEFRLRAPEGGWRWTNVRATPVLDAAGQIEKWVGMNFDVHARKHAEAALRESEARFRALATVGSSSVYRMSPDWREMRRLDGVAFLADTEVTTNDWVEVYIPLGEQTRVREAINQAVSSKGVFELEHRVLRADGTIGWTFSRAIPLLDDAGEIVEWFGAATDVTARVKADQSFTRLFQASPAPFLVVKPDAPRFTITEVNDAYLTATMRTRETVVGRGIFEAYPDDPDANTAGVSNLRASLERVLASYQPDALPGLKYDIARPDGTFESRWWSPINSPVLNEDGELEAIIHNANDVTAARRAEIVLRESEERFAQFASSSSDGLWIRHAGTLAMEYTSPAIQTIYGFSSGAILDDMQRWVDLIVPADRETVIAHIEQARSGVSVTHEFRIQRPSDGALRWIRNTDFPLHDVHGHVQRIGGIAQDVTEAKMATERQDVLIAELQHRTRNLIAVVRSIADDTMEHTGPTEAFSAAFADRLSALSRVQGLLSRSEAEPITIGALLRLELDALGAGRVGDHLSIDGPDVFLKPSTVQTLALALHELATNARKYGALSHAQGHLAVMWREVIEDDGPRLVLEWIENGLEQAIDQATSATPSIAASGGYGRELIELALPHALGARTTYALTDNGVRCTIDLPVRPNPLELGNYPGGREVRLRPSR